MKNEIYTQAQATIQEMCEKAKLEKGDILVVGGSTSEIIGDKIGSNSSPEIAQTVIDAILGCLKDKGIFLAVQCCEHLNRAIVIEREALPFVEAVNVVPQPKAGGSLATCAYKSFAHPIVIEHVRADAGIDIGFTLIGMHLKEVAVPLRLENNVIGKAFVVGARTRPKFIGGIRAVYDEKLL
jgi:uncharacterized protein (TIGR01440 family)